MHPRGMEDAATQSATSPSSISVYYYESRTSHYSVQSLTESSLAQFLVGGFDFVPLLMLLRCHRCVAYREKEEGNYSFI